jgi:hypothetical protein
MADEKKPPESGEQNEPKWDEATWDDLHQAWTD